MSNDIERLLAAAADDTDRPLHTDIDAILARGRRSVRRGRIAVASTAVLTTAAIIGGVAAWSNTVNDSADPAGDPKNQTITVDSKTGQVVDNESGRPAMAPVPKTGNVMTPTFSAPTSACCAGTSGPTIWVIAPRPAPNMSMPGYRSTEFMSSFMCPAFHSSASRSQAS